MRRLYAIIVAILAAALCLCTPSYGTSMTDANFLAHNCPQISTKLDQYLPKGNTTAGAYIEIDDMGLRMCVLNCCMKETCNVAFFVDKKCYHITCYSNALCMPMKNTNPNTQVCMVMVRPVGHESWAQVFKRIGDENMPKYDPFMEQNAYNFDLSNYSESCSIDGNNCPENEECVLKSKKSREGTCRCIEGFQRSSDGYCFPLLVTPYQPIKDYQPKRKLHVYVENAEVQLPDNEISLIAVANPGPTIGEKFNYEWTSIRKPDGSNAVKAQNAYEMKLTKLTEGLYTFKVNVSSDLSYGETFVNVTVLPPSRINEPPQIVITPANQTIKLPNTKAVLDASTSTDDDSIVSYHWELQQAPVGYEPHLSDLPTLALTDLDKPGNYTFKLTVTDTDKAISTATANITVLQTTDYPPEADAGPDVIVYLPHNEITLNATMSIDDHNITTWEWTKIETNLVVDMQDTRTPFLKLSNLEEGVYTFQLKVTDSNNQSSTAKVRVFVKPPTNQPPVARTGANITINLPRTWVVISANQSTDDNKIVKYQWAQLSGPSKASLMSANESSTNVTLLTKGDYTFQVTVTDDNGNAVTAKQYVSVDQNTNHKPHANAGNNFDVYMPQSGVYLNGSQSTDDWAIVRWKWQRNADSLAYGEIGEGTDESPVLLFSNFVPGQYIFDLTVYDQQGLSDTNSVRVRVLPDPHIKSLVDMIIDADVKEFTQLQYDTVVDKMQLLVQEGTKLVVHQLRSEVISERVVIRFGIEGEGTPLDANFVVRYFRAKLMRDAEILGYTVKGFQTAVCQNLCSGHGHCDELTRECICDTFWMHDHFWSYWRPHDDSNCGWSVLYVILSFIVVLMLIVGLLWTAIYICIYRCSCNNNNPNSPRAYKLIESSDDGCRHEHSDSDSDSDVVFESRNKNRYVCGHKQRNGFHKMSRRVKT